MLMWYNVHCACFLKAGTTLPNGVNRYAAHQNGQLYTESTAPKTSQLWHRTYICRTGCLSCDSKRKVRKDLETWAAGHKWYNTLSWQVYGLFTGLHMEWQLQTYKTTQRIISYSYTQLSRAYQICSVIVVIKHTNIDSNMIEQLVDHYTLMVIKYRIGIDGCKLSHIG